jgi:hypothetical protein
MKLKMKEYNPQVQWDEQKQKHVKHPRFVIRMEAETLGDMEFFMSHFGITDGEERIVHIELDSFRTCVYNEPMECKSMAEMGLA